MHGAAGRRRGPSALPRPAIRRAAERVGQALEAPRRAAAGGPHQCGRVLAAGSLPRRLRRPDVVGVARREGAADPRRGSGDLCRRGLDRRGRRLDRRRALRRARPQRLRRGLQGLLEPGARLSLPGILRGPRSALPESGREARRRDRSAGAEGRGPDSCDGIAARPRTGDGRGGRDHRCAQRSPRRHGGRGRAHGARHRDLDLPHASRRPVRAGRRHRRRREGRNRRGLLRLRSGSAGRRRSLRLVRRPRGRRRLRRARTRRRGGPARGAGTARPRLVERQSVGSRRR